MCKEIRLSLVNILKVHIKLFESHALRIDNHDLVNCRGVSSYYRKIFQSITIDSEYWNYGVGCLNEDCIASNIFNLPSYAVYNVPFFASKEEMVWRFGKRDIIILIF